jgi:hypothetical protein
MSEEGRYEGDCGVVTASGTWSSEMREGLEREVRP